MSSVGLILEEKAADIGNFLVGRLLPFRQKRAVGPFVFIDHMGPEDLKDYQNLDVPPHPHIGLSTLTFLFEGTIEHRDSMGNDVVIHPGAVNWMTAGKGVVHSERTPASLRHSEKQLHGLQIWVAMPKSLEQSEPSFTHIDAESIPQWVQDSITIKLIAGEVFGRKSPVPVLSPLYFLELKSKQDAYFNIGKDLYGEVALYVLEGSIEANENTYGTKQLMVAKESSICHFKMKANTTVYLFGGEPLPEEHFIYWNFVSSDKALIEMAKQDWIEQRFAPVPGETEFVPFPQ